MLPSGITATRQPDQIGDIQGLSDALDARPTTAAVDAAIAAIELLPGPKGDTGSPGSPGIPGAPGEPGPAGSDATIPQPLDTTDSPTFSDVLITAGICNFLSSLFDGTGGWVYQANYANYANSAVNADYAAYADNADYATLARDAVSTTSGDMLYTLFDGTGGLTAQTKGLELIVAAPSSPAAGQTYFNTTDKHFYGYNGTAWVRLDN